MVITIPPQKQVDNVIQIGGSSRSQKPDAKLYKYPLTMPRKMKERVDQIRQKGFYTKKFNDFVLECINKELEKHPE